MIDIRRSCERGYANHGWLEARHTFSFADYYDPNFMGFSVLRVINQDKVSPGMGFGTHGHKDMEIITYVTHGVLAHKDTLGNAAEIHPGEVQRMSAGTGIRHSEFNHSQSEYVQLLQIWILPIKNDLPPSYEQKSFLKQLSTEEFVLVASQDSKNGSVRVHQDISLYAGKFKAQTEKTFEMSKSRKAWVQVIKGDLVVNSLVLSEGDGAAIVDESVLSLKSNEGNEFLFFDLP